MQPLNQHIVQCGFILCCCSSVSRSLALCICFIAILCFQCFCVYDQLEFKRCYYVLLIHFECGFGWPMFAVVSFFVSLFGTKPILFVFNFDIIPLEDNNSLPHSLHQPFFFCFLYCTICTRRYMRACFHAETRYLHMKLTSDVPLILLLHSH